MRPQSPLLELASLPFCTAPNFLPTRETDWMRIEHQLVRITGGACSKPPTRERVALLQAGGVVVAAAMGARLTSAEIMPKSHPGGSWHGVVDIAAGSSAVGALTARFGSLAALELLDGGLARGLGCAMLAAARFEACMVAAETANAGSADLATILGLPAQGAIGMFAVATALAVVDRDRKLVRRVAGSLGRRLRLDAAELARETQGVMPWTAELLSSYIARRAREGSMS